MEQNQENECVKTTQMEIQIGNILAKLKEYENKLWLLIKEIGNKMEQVTSSICATNATLGKRTNEEIISLGGPSKWIG